MKFLLFSRKNKRQRGPALNMMMILFRNLYVYKYGMLYVVNLLYYTLPYNTHYKFAYSVSNF